MNQIQTQNMAPIMKTVTEGEIANSNSRKLVLAYDVGTSGIKAVAISHQGELISSSEKNYPITYPRPGWAEQNPNDYWEAIKLSTSDLMQKGNITKEEVKGIVFGTQAMGIIPMDASGQVLSPNISWVDGRAEVQARKLMRRLGGKWLFKKILGIEITGKDVIPKLLWIKENKPKIYQQTSKFLDVNGYLKYKATGKMVAEWSGACSYSFDLKKKTWTEGLFKIVGLDVKKLPRLVKSIQEVGNLTTKAAEELGLSCNTVVFGGCDDTQSATLGSKAVGEGDTHIYLGTSAWIITSTQKRFKFRHGAVTMQSADPQKYIIVGITESAGANINWLLEKFYKSDMEQLPLDKVYSMLNHEISQISPGSSGLIITPWFLGERCPISTTTTRSTIFNLGLEHTRGHIGRAMYEGICYNLRWILENFRKDFGFDPSVLKVLGGGSQSEVWMQILADITQKRIEVTNQPKFAGAIGTAMIGFIGLKIKASFMEVGDLKCLASRKVFTPNKSNYHFYAKQFEEYKKLYFKLRDMYKSANSQSFEEN